MNETTDPYPEDIPPEDPRRSAADISARLADEPVPDDELSRERRIRAALTVFDEQHSRPTVRTAAVPVPRRRADPGWLAVAAVLAVFAVGGFLIMSSRSTEDASTSDSAESAIAELTDSTLAPGPAGASLDPAEPATLADLGTQADRDAVLSAVDERLGAVSNDFATPPSTTSGAGSSAEDGARSPEPDELDGATGGEIGATREATPSELPCIGQLQATGEQPVAVASIAGVPVVVARRPAGYEVYDSRSCTPLQ